ncbi:MAG: hypothetical protein AB1508_15960 [Pseudomonadota bacterium]
MKAPAYGKSILLAGGITAAVLVIVIGVYSARQFSSTPPELAASAETPAKKPPASVFTPSLYCEFYDYLHERVIVAFGFAVTLPKGAPPRFDEKYQGSRDGTQTFDAADRQAWPFAHDDDGTPMITSPDGATRIMLYGLKPDAAGAQIDEAGLRSNDFRNLDGQCRQANFNAKSN